MSLVLMNQVEASERSAEEIEGKFGQGGGSVPSMQDVRDLARSLVQLYRDITGSVDRWRAGPSSGESEPVNREWLSIYRRLEAIFARTQRFIRRAEQSGHAVDGKPEFEKAWRELRAIVSFSPEDVQKSVEQAGRGDVRPLGEVRDELRDSPVH